MVEDYLEDDKEVSAQVKGSEGKWYETTVVFDAEDEIADYICSCPAAGAYLGMCKHCVAVALAYRDTQMPADSLGNVDFPSKTPANRRTSDTLKDTIAKYAVRNNAYLLGSITDRYAWNRSSPLLITSFTLNLK
ncbi:hypothetical protein LC724_30580 [Blautia sp. RD014234]|nr:hypothetical protein [Blautia parvula]